MAQIQSHTLGKAPQVAGTLNRYFGIDLARLPSMSDQELAGIADRAQAMKRLVDVLPILEQHFETLIQGQLAYEEFVQRVLKSGAAAGKKIDKALVDAFLLDRGYQQHQQQLQQKLGNETRLQDAEHRNQLQLGQMDFNACLQLIHRKHQNQVRQVQEKVPNALQQMAQSEQQRLANQQRKDLLTYGTQGNPKRRGWGDRFKSFLVGA